jgi:hypothetical protein
MKTRQREAADLVLSSGRFWYHQLDGAGLASDRAQKSLANAKIAQNLLVDHLREVKAKKAALDADGRLTPSGKAEKLAKLQTELRAELDALLKRPVFNEPAVARGHATGEKNAILRGDQIANASSPHVTVDAKSLVAELRAAEMRRHVAGIEGTLGRVELVKQAIEAGRMDTWQAILSAPPEFGLLDDQQVEYLQGLAAEKLCPEHVRELAMLDVAVDSIREGERLITEAIDEMAVDGAAPAATAPAAGAGYAAALRASKNPDTSTVTEGA